MIEDCEDEDLSEMMPNGQIIFEKKTAGQITRHTKRQRNKHSGPFHDDLRKLMFGYGDDVKPNESSVELLEVFVEEFITNLVTRAARRS